jgi:hypothetical protein
MNIPSQPIQTANRQVPVPHVRGVRGRPVVARGRAHQTAGEFAGFMPAVSIVGIVLGTVLALALMPENVRPPGVLRPAAIAMILGLVTGPLLSATSNLRFLLRTENVIGMTPVYWLMLDLVTASYEMKDVDPGSVRESFVVICVCMCAYWVGTMGRPWRLPQGFLDTCKRRIKTEALLPIILLCFVLAMCRFAIPCNFDLILMVNSVGGARWTAPWARGALGGWDAFADHLSYFGYLLPTLAVVMARRKSWFSGGTIIAILCALIFLLFLSQSGARRIMGVCLGAALFYWIMDQRRMRPRDLLILVACLGGILWVMQTMIVSRTFGLREMGVGNAGVIAFETMKGENLGASVPVGLHIDDNILRLAQSVMYVPSRYDYVYHGVIWQYIVRPIPRVLWPGKPTDAGFKLYEIINTGASLSTTIVGEFWISLGYIAVILGGWFYGRLATLSSPLFLSAPETMAPMFYGYITMTLFVGYRSLVEVILFSYALLGWWAAIWIMNKFRR